MAQMGVMRLDAILTTLGRQYFQLIYRHLLQLID